MLDAWSWLHWLARHCCSISRCMNSAWELRLGEAATSGPSASSAWGLAQPVIQLSDPEGNFERLEIGPMRQLLRLNI